MSFLRRLLGGDRGAGADPAATAAAPIDHDPGLSADEAERRHEQELLRAEAERLDELAQRQLRYATHAWEPPAQGGERRADDEERASEG